MSDRDENPVNLTRARAAPRCGAKNRRGAPCQAPAMPNGRCRLHGGKSTGPRTPEGLARLRAARTKHGAFTAEARAFRALIREMKAGAKRAVEVV